MGLIFLASSDAASGERSSRLLGPLVRFFAPGLSPEEVGLVVLVVRKAAHFTAFGVLAALLWRALPARRPGWCGRRAGLALALTAAYAVSDEGHQSLVPTRRASAADVLLDTAGGAAALAAIWGWGRRRGRW
jgi:VanZ family protein